jgi:tyrosine-protein kinase Etk/Wzc
MSIPAVGASNLLLRLSGYRWLLVGLPLVLGIGVGVKSALSLPVFTAYARLLPPQTNTATASSLLGQIGGTAVLGASALALKNPSDLYAALFYSRTVQDDVIAQFKLAKHYDEPDRDDLRALVGKRTKVEVGRDGIITLAYTDISAESAADIANGMIAAMYKISKILAKGEAERRIDFYDGLIREAKEQVEDANRRLQEVEQATGLTRLQGQEEATTAAVVELRGMIATREVELRKMAVTATERHPEVVRMRTELAALRAQLSGLAYSANNTDGGPSTQVKSKAQAAEREPSQNKGIFIPVESYPALRAKVEPLRREVEINGNVLEQLTKARALSRIDESRDFSVISILDAAVAPTKKSGPRIYVNAAVGGLIGFFLAVILGLTWDFLLTDPARRARWRRVFKSCVRLGRQPRPGPST